MAERLPLLPEIGKFLGPGSALVVCRPGTEIGTRVWSQLGFRAYPKIFQRVKRVEVIAAIPIKIR